MKAQQSRWPYLIDTTKTRLVYAEVKKIIHLVQPAFRFNRLSQLFEDVVRLYRGYYPGYRPCSTCYHNLSHVMDTVLAMARLMHGATVFDHRFTTRGIGLGIAVAAFHDTGYIQKNGDRSGTGGKYAGNYLQRSIKFMEGYFLEHDYSIEYFEDAKKVLKCISPYVDLERMRFKSEELKIIGKMLATANVVAQLGDRAYLERLLLLFRELLDARPEYCCSEMDVFRYRSAFHDMMMRRLEASPPSTKGFMAAHFGSRLGVDRDFYEEQMESNLKHLLLILSNEKDYRDFLRRSGIVKRLRNMDHKAAV
jgi:hypothetical protein